MTVFVATLTFAQTLPPSFATLHSFNGPYEDGSNPAAGVIQTSSGVIFGTTIHGSYKNQGTLFRLTRAAGGAWTERILLSFGNNGDGCRPAGDLLDVNGVIYSTTFQGGAFLQGSMFDALLTSTGLTVTDLHDFDGGDAYGDGSQPEAGLVMSPQGSFYGTTEQGGLYGPGSFGPGTVFFMTPPSTPGAGWSEGLLYNLSGGGDGAQPEAPLVMDAGGNLYGTAYSGGYGYGTVFELTAPASAGGGWGFNVIHTFSAYGDGANPQAGLIFDVSGNLFGATVNGGTAGMGTVFELTPESGGAYWNETIIYNFSGNGDGANPEAGLTFSNGVLYGTTYNGGSSSLGTVFSLAPPSTPGGAWTESVLHRFTGQNTDGANPQARLFQTANGSFLGTTYNGGTYGAGTVFRLTP